MILVCGYLGFDIVWRGIIDLRCSRMLPYLAAFEVVADVVRYDPGAWYNDSTCVHIRGAAADNYVRLTPCGVCVSAAYSCVLCLCPVVVYYESTALLPGHGMLIIRRCRTCPLVGHAAYTVIGEESGRFIIHRHQTQAQTQNTGPE